MLVEISVRNWRMLLTLQKQNVSPRRTIGVHLRGAGRGAGPGGAVYLRDEFALLVLDAEAAP